MKSTEMNQNDLNYLIDLKYGNLSYEQSEVIRTKTNLFSEMANSFISNPYPLPESTAKELSELSKIQKDNIKDDMQEKIVDFCVDVDENLVGIISAFIEQFGIKDEQKTIQYLSNELLPLILKLKKHYNRPRPYQVAYYLRSKFSPFESVSNSPSYPSGRAVQVYFISEVLMYKYKEKQKDIKEMADMIASSRLSMGVNFKSDIDFAKDIVKELIKEKAIRKKFFKKQEDVEKESPEQKKGKSTNTPPNPQQHESNEPTQ